MSKNNPLVGNVLIAEDHPMFAKGLEKALLDAQIALQVFIVPDGNQALITARKHQIDLAFLDCHMPSMDGITCTQKLKELFPAIKIISLSGTCTFEKVAGAIDAGSDGYLTKDFNENNLSSFIISVLNNEKPLSDPAKNVLTNQIINNLSFAPKIDFSDREIEVGYILSKGKTLQEAADILFISLSTVKTYKERMFEKAGVNSKASLVAFLIENKVFENYIFPHKMP